MFLCLYVLHCNPPPPPPPPPNCLGQYSSTALQNYLYRNVYSAGKQKPQNVAILVD